jgi:3-deoxy-7-phosphoheptulonate synthase
LILEVHPDPENAMSDGYQSLTFDGFADTMRRCVRVAEAVGRTM